MKARVKATGAVTDVRFVRQPFFYYDGINTMSKYEAKELELLEFPDIVAVDWQAYRREVAKECMATLIGTNVPTGGYEVREAASIAVDAADALINRLKETEQ